MRQTGAERLPDRLTAAVLPGSARQDQVMFCESCSRLLTYNPVVDVVADTVRFATNRLIRFGTAWLAARAGRPLPDEFSLQQSFPNALRLDRAQIATGSLGRAT